MKILLALIPLLIIALCDTTKIEILFDREYSIKCTQKTLCRVKFNYLKGKEKKKAMTLEYEPPSFDKSGDEFRFNDDTLTDSNCKNIILKYGQQELHYTEKQNPDNHPANTQLPCVNKPCYFIDADDDSKKFIDIGDEFLDNKVNTWFGSFKIGDNNKCEIQINKPKIKKRIVL